MSDGATIPAVSDQDKPLVLERLVLWYFLASLFFFGVALLGGLLYAIQLVRHYPMGDLEFFSPGRWRMVHTNGMAYGFIANAFLGMLHYVIPRLTLRPVLDVKLSYFIFFTWQIIVLASAGGFLFGPMFAESEWAEWIQAQGVEWGETPRWVDPVAQLGLLLVSINFLAPIIRQGDGPLYVTLWYFMAAFVWTFLTYAMGNFLPQYVFAGTGGGAITGMFIHDLVGLFVTPMGWGMMYFFVPIILQKPIWSHALSLVGFWGLAFFYPLTGIHHFLYTPIPMTFQHGSVISTIAVEIVVTTVMINFVGTVWGSWGIVFRNVPLRWFYLGILFYFLTCLQCAFQTTLWFQQVIHFTDWVVGHAHLVMFGVFGFWILGMMTYLIPRLLHRPWYSYSLIEWHFWLSGIGMLIMFFDLMVAGVFQGFTMASLAPWEEYINISFPYWVVRLYSGIAIIVGQILFFYNIYMTIRTVPRAEDGTTVTHTEPQSI